MTPKKDPKNGQKCQKRHNSGFQETDVLGAKAAPGTNRSRAGTANQKPQSHYVAKLSEEVRNHKPCESRVAQHYVTSSSRGAKKGASWRCLLLESRATRQLHSETPHLYI